MTEQTYNLKEDENVCCDLRILSDCLDDKYKYPPKILMEMDIKNIDNLDETEDQKRILKRIWRLYKPYWK